jgi:hypothetical protein
VTQATVLRLSRKGFSLVELLTAMFVALLIGGAILTLLVGQMQFTASQNRNMINQEDLRSTLSFMADEIRTTGNGSAEPFVLEATDTSYYFESDLDGDGIPDRVKYELNGDQLLRRLYTTPDDGVTWNEVATDVLLADMRELSFTYYGLNNTTLPDINDISAVQIRAALSVEDTETSLTQGKIAEQEMIVRSTIRNRLL